jgi:hypothetical protein
MSVDKVYYTGVVLDDSQINKLRDSIDEALDSFYESGHGRILPSKTMGTF